MTTGHLLRIGFLPLLDCAPLVIAKEKGFFTAEGNAVELRKGQSWAQIKDWLVADQLEAAHMLITMPIQLTLGLGGPREQVDFAYTLNRRGNGIILGNALWNGGARDAAGLAAWMAAHPAEKIRLGVVFPRGTQEYFLRYWLALAGLFIGPRISLSIIPPQELVGRLRKKEVEGFCVAEPWSRRAAASKLGRLVAESGTLLPGLADKVLAVKDAWHRAHGGEHAGLLRALARAARWLEDPANAGEAADILASKRYVNTPRSVVEGALADEKMARDAAGPSPYADSPHRPSRSHVRWYLEQMGRWGHLPPQSSPDVDRICLEDFHAATLGASA
jgi:ABC-type nitrate/sulfonate/bicarbonate transport system substrate-binding protein